MKANTGDKQGEDIDKQITDNKRRIKFLTDINEELTARRHQLNKFKALQKEADEFKKELQEIHQKVNNAWQEKIYAEQTKTNELEKEWKCLIAQIQANADTPGYQQAIKHTDLQSGLHTKQDAPSTRTNYKITAARLQNEIKTLQQRVNIGRLSLIDEIKKKSTLEEEVRELRAGMSNRRSVTPSKFSSSIPDLHLRSTARVN